MRNLLLTHCFLLVVLTSPLGARSRDVEHGKPLSRIVILPYIDVGFDYKIGQGPEEAMCHALQQYPNAWQFKVGWVSLGANHMDKSAAVYNRVQHRVNIYTYSGGNGEIERSHYVFSNVNDEILQQVVEMEEDHSRPSKFFDNLERLHCPEKMITNWKKYFPSYYN